MTAAYYERRRSICRRGYVVATYSLAGIIVAVATGVTKLKMVSSHALWSGVPG